MSSFFVASLLKVVLQPLGKQLNEVNLNTRNLGEGMQLPVGGLNTEALFTKPPDYLQVRFTTS